jgi:hypothetical protein
MVKICHLLVKPLQEKMNVQELKLLKLEESKWIMAIKSRSTRIDRLCILGEITLGESVVREFGTPEARIPKIDPNR